jgi:hypothetical protein
VSLTVITDNNDYNDQASNSTFKLHNRKIESDVLCTFPSFCRYVTRTVQFSIATLSEWSIVLACSYSYYTVESTSVECIVPLRVTISCINRKQDHRGPQWVGPPAKLSMLIELSESPSHPHIATFSLTPFSILSVTQTV